MKQHYEDKLAQLQTRIRATQEERDKVLASIGMLDACYSSINLPICCWYLFLFFLINFLVGGHNNQQNDKAKKVREEYERKLLNMQKEVARLQSAKKEHDRLARSQTQYENQVKTLRNDLADMKRTKVSVSPLVFVPQMFCMI